MDINVLSLLKVLNLNILGENHSDCTLFYDYVSLGFRHALTCNWNTRPTLKTDLPSCRSQKLECKTECFSTEYISDLRSVRTMVSGVLITSNYVFDFDKYTYIVKIIYVANFLLFIDIVRGGWYRLLDG